jgi:hypothetical protein
MNEPSGTNEWNEVSDMPNGIHWDFKDEINNRQVPMNGMKCLTCQMVFIGISKMKLITHYTIK